MLRKYLKPNAVPRKFPGLPDYLSSSRPEDRSRATTSSSRLERENLLISKKCEDFLLADKVTSFEELLSKLPSSFPPSWMVITLNRSKSVIFEEVSINDEGNPGFLFSLTIEETLNFAMFSNGIKVSVLKVKNISPNQKIERASDIQNILAFLSSYSEMNPQPEDVIEHCVHKLKRVQKESTDASSEMVTKLSFITEQLDLSKQKCHTKRYSSSLLWCAMTWQKTSPSLYSMMLEDCLLSLPSISYLKQLSGAFSIESGLSVSTISYLRERIKPLNEKERTVALAIDEVLH